VSVLDRKLARDLGRLRGQVATIALVLACGVMSMIMLRATWESLLRSRDSGQRNNGVVLGLGWFDL